jgi:hypothetical protein
VSYRVNDGCDSCGHATHRFGHGLGGRCGRTESCMRRPAVPTGQRHIPHWDTRQCDARESLFIVSSFSLWRPLHTRETTYIATCSATRTSTTLPADSSRSSTFAHVTTVVTTDVCGFAVGASAPAMPGGVHQVVRQSEQRGVHSWRSGLVWGAGAQLAPLTPRLNWTLSCGSCMSSLCSRGSAGFPGMGF